LSLVPSAVPSALSPEPDPLPLADTVPPAVVVVVAVDPDAAVVVVAALPAEVVVEVVVELSPAEVVVTPACSGDPLSPSSSEPTTKADATAPPTSSTISATNTVRADADSSDRTLNSSSSGQRQAGASG
jgi:hypothetical protein